MSGINGLGSPAPVNDLIQIVEEGLRAKVDFAEKVIKVANGARVAQAEATGLGMAIDLYA